MLQKGQDPKDLLIKFCEPQCISAKEKLTRCEATLKALSSSDPEKSCMYRMRDFVTCVEGCVIYSMN